MPSTEMKTTTFDGIQSRLWMIAFVLLMPLHGMGFLDFNAQAAQGQGDVPTRLEKVEKGLEEVKAEQKRERLELEKLAREQKERDKQWETKFDLLRRDPRSRQELSKEGWLRFEGFESQVRFGGFFQTNIIHNFQDPDNKFNKFKPGSFPVPSGKSTSTEIDPRTTRLVLETRTPTPIGNYSTFISIDFFGNNDPGDIRPRLRQGYLTGVGVISGSAFLIGQAFSTFRDVQVFPEMFDLQGPNGWSRLFNGMVRWSFHLDQSNHWVATFAVEDPDSDISNGNGESALPDGILRVDYNGDLHHFMLAFVGRQLKGTNASGSGTDRSFGHGFNLSGKIGIPDCRDTFKFQGFYGSGIGRYINDLDATGGQDAYYDDNDKKLKRLMSAGGFGGYQHWWTAAVRSTAVFGFVWVDNRGVQPGSAFKSSYYTLANLIWSPFSHFDVGLEYLWGQRKNKNGQTGHANRMMGVVKWHY